MGQSLLQVVKRASAISQETAQKLQQLDADDSAIGAMRDSVISSRYNGACFNTDMWNVTGARIMHADLLYGCMQTFCTALLKARWKPINKRFGSNVR